MGELQALAGFQTGTFMPEIFCIAFSRDFGRDAPLLAMLEGVLLRRNGSMMRCTFTAINAQESACPVCC